MITGNMSWRQPPCTMPASEEQDDLIRGCYDVCDIVLSVTEATCGKEVRPPYIKTRHFGEPCLIF
jgi:hypothetical protein